jgi:hypothetical protein
MPRGVSFFELLIIALWMIGSTLREVVMEVMNLLRAAGYLKVALVAKTSPPVLRRAWANTPPPSATPYVAQKKHVEGRSKPDTKPQEEPRTQRAAGPQEAEKPVVRSLHEE